MALVDYERAWRALGQVVASKPSHGARDLALEMARLEALNAVEESVVERMLRMHGFDFAEHMRVTARALAHRDTPPDHGGELLVPAMAVERDHRPNPHPEVHSDGNSHRDRPRPAAA